MLIFTVTYKNAAANLWVLPPRRSDRCLGTPASHGKWRFQRENPIYNENKHPAGYVLLEFYLLVWFFDHVFSWHYPFKSS